jgi:prevent-host-death family protein
MPEIESGNILINLAFLAKMYIMNTNKVTVSATELKNNTSEILNRVEYGKETVSISKHGKIVADIVPRKEPAPLVVKESFKDFYGALPDFPSVEEIRSARRKRKRTIKL